ncbi:MAG: Peptidase family [Phycisphaerales bacterium]|nr:Peptidase family [Phycisphaerales bacterium]
MGYQDRDYSRGRVGNGGMMLWLWYGSVPLFRIFGIDVRAHSMLLITITLGLLFGVGIGFGYQDRLSSMAALFTIVLLHEFGHCFACRWVGGSADEIVMHPLGGLALCAPPQRPLPTFITVAGGPAVNVLICVVTGIILFVMTGWLPASPFTYHPFPFFSHSAATLETIRFTYWVYEMSWSLLVFNLLPIFPLDGGQMLQAALWPRMGYYRSMKLTTEIGMFASVGGGAFALATGNFGLVILAGFGFYACYMMRQQLLANGAEGYDSQSYAVIPEAKLKPKKKSWIAERRERKSREAESAEATAVDQILEKVAQSGMHSLTSGEKKTLERASENQRKRDTARGRRY